MQLCYRRVSVRPSFRHKPVLYRNDWTNRAGSWQGSFLPPIPYCVVEIRVSVNTELYPGTQFSGVENFATASDRVVNKTRDCRRLIRRSKRRRWTHIFIKRRSTVNSITSISCTTFSIQLSNRNNWQDFHWHSESCGPEAFCRQFSSTTVFNLPMRTS